MEGLPSLHRNRASALIFLELNFHRSFIQLSWSLTCSEINVNIKIDCSHKKQRVIQPYFSAPSSILNETPSILYLTIPSGKKTGADNQREDWKRSPFYSPSSEMMATRVALCLSSHQPPLSEIVSRGRRRTGIQSSPT